MANNQGMHASLSSSQPAYTARCGQLSFWPPPYLGRGLMMDGTFVSLLGVGTTMRLPALPHAVV